MHLKSRTLFASILTVTASVAQLAVAGFAAAQTASPDKASRASYTLPLTSFYDTPHPLPPGEPGELIRSEPAHEYRLPYDLTALRILYHSRTANGEDVPVSGVVLIPEGKPPAGGWPVIAWAHEFRGAARQCAPSLMRNLGAGPVLAMYANLGYAVVATDYAGLGASGSAVLDMRSNGLDIRYAIPAARAAATRAGTAIGSKWVAVGPFQGAMAAVAVAETEIRDSGYLGSVATSGLADAQPAFQTGQAASDRALLVLAATVKVLYPGFQVGDMLKEKALPAYRGVQQNCAAETEPEFTIDMLKPGWESSQFLREFFAGNTPGQKTANAPLLVVSGQSDPAVPVEITERTVTRMCKRGDRILFLKYADVDASGAMGGSVADQISWIKARFAGHDAPSNCP